MCRLNRVFRVEVAVTFLLILALYHVLVELEWSSHFTGKRPSSDFRAHKISSSFKADGVHTALRESHSSTTTVISEQHSAGVIHTASVDEELIPNGELNDDYLEGIDLDDEKMLGSESFSVRFFTPPCIPEGSHSFPVVVDLFQSVKPMLYLRISRDRVPAPRRVAVRVELREDDENSSLLSSCDGSIHFGRGSCSMFVNGNIVPSVGARLHVVTLEHDAPRLYIAAQDAHLQQLSKCDKNRVQVQFNSTSFNNYEGTRVKGFIDVGPDADLIIENEDLVIPSHLALILWPGTIVYLGANRRIRVSGNARMYVSGTRQRGVWFTRTNVAGADWGEITVEGGGILVLLHALLSGGGGDTQRRWGHSGSQAVIRCVDSVVSVLDSVIVDCASGKAVGSERSVVYVRDTLISRVDQGGEYRQSRVDMQRAHVLEIPDADGFVEDDDNDGTYVMGGIRDGGRWWRRSRIVASVFAVGEDDAIDQNGGELQVRATVISNWTHEGIASSGKGRSQLWLSDVSVEHCEQGLELGYGAPWLSVKHATVTHCRVCVRIGDSYNWASSGRAHFDRLDLQHCTYKALWNHHWTSRLQGWFEGEHLTPEQAPNSHGKPLLDTVTTCNVFVSNASNTVMLPNEAASHTNELWWDESGHGGEHVEFDSTTRYRGSFPTMKATVECSNDTSGFNVVGSRYCLSVEDCVHRHLVYPYPLGPKPSFVRSDCDLLQESDEYSVVNNGWMKSARVMQTPDLVHVIEHVPRKSLLEGETVRSAVGPFTTTLELFSYLSHAHVVRPLFVCENDTYVSYVDAFVKGTAQLNSAKFMLENGIIEGVRHGKQLASAIAYLHESPIGTVRHGDLKTVNILLRDDDEGPMYAHVIDIDAATINLNPRSPSNVPNFCFQLKRSYMHLAPECQRESKEAPRGPYGLFTDITAATDVFAVCQRMLGCMARAIELHDLPAVVDVNRFLMDDALAFNESAKGELWGEIFNLEALEALYPGIESILPQCLTRNVTERITARQLASLLEELEHKLIQTRPSVAQAQKDLREKIVTTSYAPSKEFEKQFRDIGKGRTCAFEFACMLKKFPVNEEQSCQSSYHLNAYEYHTKLNVSAPMVTWAEFQGHFMWKHNNVSNVQIYKHSYLNDANVSGCGVSFDGFLREDQQKHPVFGRVHFNIVHADNAHVDDQSFMYEILTYVLDRLLGFGLVPPTTGSTILLYSLRKDRTWVPLSAVRCLLHTEGKLCASSQVLLDGVQSVHDIEQSLTTYSNWREYVVFMYIARCARSFLKEEYVNKGDEYPPILLMRANDRCFTREAVVKAPKPTKHQHRYEFWEQQLEKALCSDGEWNRTVHCNTPEHSFQMVIQRLLEWKTLFPDVDVAHTLSTVILAEESYTWINRMVSDDVWADLQVRVDRVRSIAASCS